MHSKEVNQSPNKNENNSGFNLIGVLVTVLALITFFVDIMTGLLNF